MISKMLSVVVAAAALAATPALAHTGDHAHAGFFGTVIHFLTQPDHLVPLAAAVGIALYFKCPAGVARALRGIARRFGR
jgi:hydrogenase/urease accessory protein HupE